MNLEYDDVIPGSLECSEGHRQVLHMPPQPVTAGSGMWSGSFGVSNKGFQHTSMFKQWYHRNTKNVENVFQCHSFEGVGLRPCLEPCRTHK